MTTPAFFNSDRFRRAACALLAMVMGTSLGCAAKAEADKTPAAPPDVLVLSDGDTLHGKFLNEIAGKVTFHTESLGDVTLGWDKIKELHNSQKVGVLEQDFGGGKGKQAFAKVPIGTVDVSGGTLTVNAEGAPASIPVAKVQFVMDEAVLRKQVLSSPGFFAGWNGAATAGATVVSATTNQYTFAGAINLVRAVPVVPWLDLAQ